MEEDEDLVGDVDQELRHELERERRSSAVGLTVVDGGVDRADPQGEPVGHGVEAAVAEGVAAQQAPDGEERAAAAPKRGSTPTA